MLQLQTALVLIDYSFKRTFLYIDFTGVPQGMIMKLDGSLYVIVHHVGHNLFFEKSIKSKMDSKKHVLVMLQ